MPLPRPPATRRRPAAALLPLALAGALALPGCGPGRVRETFGLDRQAPDEFLVVRRAPLIVPPDARLRPPEPGAGDFAGPATAAPATGALEALTGRPAAGPNPAASPAERLLVEAAPGRPAPGIREAIAREDSQVALLDRGTFLFILNWQRRGAAAGEARPDLLDPVAETRRLRGEGAGDGRVETTRTASVPLPP